MNIFFHNKNDEVANLLNTHIQQQRQDVLQGGTH